MPVFKGRVATSGALLRRPRVRADRGVARFGWQARATNWRSANLSPCSLKSCDPCKPLSRRTQPGRTMAYRVTRAQRRRQGGGVG
ncbi:hypothetical protein [Xylophilus sp.]|uniref:hypothetical protein n=1 Tax=Xylophilus sp. TaxID=2653893 RepID=UPI0013BB7C1C|nr:hypothetical protein [Xylophilus sp.]KAF1048080.1 MAG: hypothetical protein GAK38_01551 [Xylophilus sp.]